MTVYVYKYCWEDPDNLDNPKGWDSAVFKTEDQATEMEAVEHLETKFPGKLVFVKQQPSQEIPKQAPIETKLVKKAPNVNSGYKAGINTIRDILGEAADFKKCVYCKDPLPRDRRLSACKLCNDANKKQTPPYTGRKQEK